MTELAAPWYATATFWTITVAAIATLLGGGLGGAWLTNKYANPKRKLQYAWLKNVSLLNTAQSATSTLHVQHGGNALRNPRLVDVMLQNPGKKAITASSFHNGDSIKIDLAANVLEVLEIKTQPTTAIAPPVSINGKFVEIAPCLISGGQYVTYSVLVDGDARNPSLRSPLEDIEPEETEFASGRERGRNIVSTAVIAINVLVLSLLSTLAFLAYSEAKVQRAEARTAYEAVEEAQEQAKRSGEVTAALCREMGRSNASDRTIVRTFCQIVEDDPKRKGP
ncbi:hypothetical protein [Streptomyces spiramyceticus]|uniref:hypothetical protein n=1 Tax=Streptomyces spiramyceticus TaxID=299717 RepID=UPI00237C4693|nr:hypothetical protein [Streptomyces spiramyceticus]